MSIEAMKLALAALETCRIRSVSEWSVEDITPKNVTAAIEALRTAIQQAEAQQPATTEPVGFTYQAEIDYANSTGGNGSFWRVPPDLDDEAVPLYTHPAPSVPADVVLDAARYRWLRDEHIGNCPESINLSHGRKPGLDAAIDAAMLAAKDTK